MRRGLRLSPEGVIPRNSHLAPIGLRVQPPGRLLRTSRVAVGSLDSLLKLDTDRAEVQLILPLPSLQVEIRI